MFKITDVESRPEVAFDDRPYWLHGLASGSGPEETAGTCLVAAFAVWDGHDAQWLARVLGWIKTLPAPPSVYLLPVDDWNKIQPWLDRLPAEQVNAYEIPSPVWLVVKDRQVRMIRRGQLQRPEILRLCADVALA